VNTDKNVLVTIQGEHNRTLWVSRQTGRRKCLFGWRSNSCCSASWLYSILLSRKLSGSCAHSFSRI